MNKSKKFRIENLILLTLVVVSIVVECISIKITFLGIDMYILRDNAIFYNQSEYKTDEGQDTYNDNDANRQEIYHSDDDFERVFSNMPLIVKLLSCVAALILVFVNPGMWIHFIICVIKTTGTRRYRRRRATRSRRAHV